jgi:hypothetical protein
MKQTIDSSRYVRPWATPLAPLIKGYSLCCPVGMIQINFAFGSASKLPKAGSTFRTCRYAQQQTCLSGLTCFGAPAGWGWRVWCRSGGIDLIRRVCRSSGSRSRTGRIRGDGAGDGFIRDTLPDFITGLTNSPASHLASPDHKPNLK